MAGRIYGFSSDAQLQATVFNGQTWQSSSQNSVLRRGAKCHYQVAEFLLHKYKKLAKSKSETSNTLLNSAEYGKNKNKERAF
jgi:hypothetical protein